MRVSEVPYILSIVIPGKLAIASATRESIRENYPPLD